MAAEIAARHPAGLRRLRASMRPRRMAAEIVARIGGDVLPVPASMRPRRMAAEIVSRDRIRRMWMDRFNEAAANGRGNRLGHHQRHGARLELQ